MSGVSSAEDCELVARVYESAMHALHAGVEISAERKLVHDVEHFAQEVNGGASFEQYFRWASLQELHEIEGHLRMLDLGEVAALLRAAMDVAFPHGLPASEEAKSEATEWTAEQEERLASLFEPLEAHNAEITDALAAYAKQHQL